MAGPSARKRTAITANIFYLITIPFLLLVLTGNTSKNSVVLRDIYFFKLDVAHIIPISVENSNLLNSVARSLGLHDYYQVGIWNFCEGYNDEGITDCSKPKSFFWFDPVSVLVNELLAGATIALPSQVVTILDLLRIGSQVMYVFFVVSAVLNFVLLFTTLLALRSRLWSIPLTLLSLISALLLTIASVIATVISVAAKIALTAQDQLNISADVGVKMFIFVWIAAVLTNLAFFLHAGMGCCCLPQRAPPGVEQTTPVDSAYTEKTGVALPSFLRRRKAGAGSTRTATSG